MRKQVVLALAATFMMSVAGTALAAPVNHFNDVPASHWSYEAVTKLNQAGIVSGYGDGTFHGERTLTRYEMAQIVANALTKLEKATDEQKAVIERLSAEYSSELENLGVRMAAVEAKTDNVKFKGEYRIRYLGTHATDEDGVKTKDNVVDGRLRLWLTGKIDDRWQFKTRLQQISDLKTSDGHYGNSYLKAFDGDNRATYGSEGIDGTIRLNRVYVHGDLNWGTIEAGKIPLYTGNGMHYSGPIDGVTVGVGKDLKVTGFFGRSLNANQISKGSYEVKNGKIITTAPVYGDNNLTGVNLDYNFTKNLNFKGAYMSANPVGSGDKFQKQKYWESALNYNLTPDLVLTGIYGGSDKDEDNRGYFGILSYKDCNTSRPGSYGMYLEYAHLEENALMDSGLTDWDLDKNQKGFYYEFNYCPAKNVKVNVNYTNWKEVKGSEKAESYGGFVTYYF